MPEYLAPGVYVEEVSFRSKSIEGVSTTTTGFIGPARNGPLTLEPELLTSLGEFERVYGDGQQLVFSDAGRMHNYLWHAVRAFFEEGGKRLYAQRVFLAGGGAAGDGFARAAFPLGVAGAIQVRSRFPGAAGNLRVRFTLRLGQNVLGIDPTTNTATLGAIQENDLVWITDRSSPIDSPPGSGTIYRAASRFDAVTQTRIWSFYDRNSTPALNLSNLAVDIDPRQSDQIRILTLTVSVLPNEPDALPLVWSDLALDPDHQQFGAPDSFLAAFGDPPNNLAAARTLPIMITLNGTVNTGHEVLDALDDASTFAGGLLAALNLEDSSEEDRSVVLLLIGGNEGARPQAAEYEGVAREDIQYKTGLKALEDIEDISIVAAPGHSFLFEGVYRSEATTIAKLLISHAERMRYRIAVLDAGNNQTIAQIRAMRAKLDSKYAALYYPWVRIQDPVTRREIVLPPSGFIAGIYARNDINRAVYKAPANETINLAIGFEQLLNKSQQEALNPEGINCLRFFEGRGMRVWGARTISSDPEWKYVNLRRYFAYLERSIDRGTQWAVFEPNGEALWMNVRLTIQDFLYNEWFMGALLGTTPEKAFFVRCDRSTMTQNDIDNGRLVCLIGVAALRPAEFVIFRIGQWTYDRKG
ncbi:MAG: phage tail sheath subtilisin-like domain-containing protein [Chloroflexales bacterium]|nr:phage tail sheath subtilisin-like domain-containing protein [Chloroflexales bacterium]